MKDKLGKMVTPNNALHKNNLHPTHRPDVLTTLELLTTEAPIAFLDIRTRRSHVTAHPMFSVNAPLDCFEAKVASLFATNRPQILLIAEDPVHCEWARDYLLKQGFPEPVCVPCTASQWETFGLPTWGGEYTASKAFGEWVEQTGSIHSIEPKQAKTHPAALQIDVRPEPEYRKFSIPNSVHCPTGRLGALATIPDQIHVHCAGRTRGIIAAQTLNDLQIPCSVAFISGGTQGWELSGETRVFDNVSSPPELASERIEASRADDLIARHSLPVVSPESLDSWLQANPTHQHIEVAEFSTTAAQIATTSLIQSTDQYIATHHIPVLISGPKPLDVLIAVLWLRRMGWQAMGYLGSLRLTEPDSSEVETATQAIDHTNRQWLDIRSSQAFQRSRVLGSRWHPRSAWHALDFEGEIGIVCDHNQDLEWTQKILTKIGRPNTPVRLFTTIPKEAIDYANLSFAQPPSDQAVFFPDRHQGNLTDAKGYLDWEHGLLPQLSALAEVPWPAIESGANPSSHLCHFYRAFLQRHRA